MTQIQRMAKAIENITDGERIIRITDYQNMDTIEVKRKDIKSFSYPALDNKVVYIDFVLPFMSSPEECQKGELHNRQAGAGAFIAHRLADSH